MKHILVVSHKNEIVDQIRSSLNRDCIIEKAENTDNAVKNLSRGHYDLICIDIETFAHSDVVSGFQNAAALYKSIDPDCRAILISADGNLSDKNIIGPVNDFVTPGPENMNQAIQIKEYIREQEIIQSELDYLRKEFWQTDAREIVRTNNPEMEKVFDQIRSVAPTKTTVLLYGETGTGKGVLANLIHRHSNREKGQFISVHCGAIPDTLLESELFGHEKGSFTGAFKRKLGKFEIASKGTIFLDEISTITQSAQIKLLQVLQDGTFSRVGGEAVFKTEARFIAATNMDLKKMCDAGIFRKDLYYRLNVFPIEIPPLRKRREDIPILIETFVSRLNKTMQKRIQHVHPDVIDAMKAYEWPGNIRELENLMERAFILETSSELTPESFPAELFNGRRSAAVFKVDTALSLSEARRLAIDAFERQFIKTLLSRNRGKINKSAEEAGISTRQFHKLLIKHGIQKRNLKFNQVEANSFGPAPVSKSPVLRK